MTADAQAAGDAPVDRQIALDDRNRPMNERFSNQYEYYLACIGYAVGFGNIWRFPYMCYKNGGFAFLIPYFVSLFFVALPMYMVETAFGQMIDMNLIHRYGSIVPGLWTVVPLQVCINFFTATYYITLMAWSMFYFFNAFSSPLPWAVEPTNVDALLTDEQKAQALWNQNYFDQTVLEKSTGIDEPGSLVGWLVFMMFLSYVVVYFASWKGLKSIGKIVWLSALAPYVVLTILLV